MRFSMEALVLQKQTAATKASKACMKAVWEFLLTCQYYA